MINEDSISVAVEPNSAEAESVLRYLALAQDAPLAPAAAQAGRGGRGRGRGRGRGGGRGGRGGAAAARKFTNLATMPVTLEREHLDKLQVSQYAVTWKIDGERRTLVAVGVESANVDEDTETIALGFSPNTTMLATCYLVDRESRVRRLNTKARVTPLGTLGAGQPLVFDGELVSAADIEATKRRVFDETRHSVLESLRWKRATSVAAQATNKRRDAATASTAASAFTRAELERAEETVRETATVRLVAIVSLELFDSLASFFDPVTSGGGARNYQAEAIVEAMMNAAVAITRLHGGEIVDAQGYATHFGLRPSSSAVLSVAQLKRYECVRAAVDELAARLRGERAQRRLCFYVNDCLHNGKHSLARRAMDFRLGVARTLLTEGALAVRKSAANARMTRANEFRSSFYLDPPRAGLHVHFKLHHQASQAPRAIYNLPRCLIGVPIDGIILAPLYRPYTCGSDEYLFKMKRFDLNTADLELGDDLLTLYARNRVEVGRLVAEHGGVVAGRIYECRPVAERRWSVCKERDKLHANHINTVESIWRIVRNPVTYEEAFAHLSAAAASVAAATTADL